MLFLYCKTLDWAHERSGNYHSWTRYAQKQDVMYNLGHKMFSCPKNDQRSILGSTKGLTKTQFYASCVDRFCTNWAFKLKNVGLTTFTTLKTKPHSTSLPSKRWF